MAETKFEQMPGSKKIGTRPSADVHPAWVRLIQYCAELAHGEIEKLKIQDGLPIIAEVTMRKIKFTL